MFKPISLKLSKDIYYFKKENNLNPTDYAIMFGGLFAEWGYKPIFEAQFDQMHVDLYVPDWNPNVVLEMCGEREREQSKNDGNRDGYLVRHQISVQRVSNKTISECIPPNEQVRLYFKGLNIFVQQLQDWKENGIPDYLENKSGRNLNDFHDDIIEWLDEQTG